MPDEYVLDVILTTHNHIELTASSITALYAHTSQPFHLIIVDDSTDVTPLYIDGLMKERTNITYIRSDVPFTSGNQIFNIGLAETLTPYVAIVMNSVTVEPGWDAQPVQMMNEHTDIGICALKNLFPDGQIESAGVHFMPSDVVDFGRFRDISTFVPSDMFHGQPGHRASDIYECDCAQWAFIMLRRKAVPVLAEDIYHGFKGWDDLDNSLVIKSDGWKIVYTGGSSGYHRPRSTRGDNGDEAQTLNKENGITFFRRWGFLKGDVDEGAVSSTDTPVREDT